MISGDGSRESKNYFYLHSKIAHKFEFTTAIFVRELKKTANRKRPFWLGVRSLITSINWMQSIF